MIRAALALGLFALLPGCLPHPVVYHPRPAIVVAPQPYYAPRPVYVPAPSVVVRPPHLVVTPPRVYVGPPRSRIVVYPR